MVEFRVVEILFPHNYNTWKLKIRQPIQSKGIWQILVEAQPIFTKETKRFAYMNKLDGYMGLIGIDALDSHLVHIVECISPKKMRDTLNSLLANPMDFKH